MWLLLTHRSPSRRLRDEIEVLISDFTAQHGWRPVSDLSWVSLEHGGLDVATARFEGALHAAALVTSTATGVNLEIVGSDEIRNHLLGVAGELVPPGAAATWWLFRPTPQVLASAGAAAAGYGLGTKRLLVQMTRALPADAPPESFPVRAYRPGADDEELLAVNNAAFAGHPEQSGWTAATLALRTAEPWFEAHGLLIHERGGRIAGFCWTKLHEGTGHAGSPEPTGEIYVIGVQPDFHGEGLGTALTLAGLAHLHRRGATRAMLYVDGANGAALAMYHRLGFTEHHTDHAFTGTWR